MRGLMGSFSVLPLADLVEHLGRKGSTGVLTCERGTVRKSLHLRDGKAVGAASNDPREYLGQLLVNFGHIDDVELAKAFKTQEETKVRLGKVLTMVGVVTPEIIRDVLAIKIRETLLDVFLWDSGVFSFDDTPPPPVDDLDALIALGDILREAEFRATAWSAFRGEFPSGAAALEVEEANVPDGFRPETVDGKVIALAREGKTIDEIGIAIHATDFHLYQRLYALARKGVLRAALAPAAPVGAAASATSELMDRARRHLAAGRPSDAEVLASRAVELDPASDPARALLAEVERALVERLRDELCVPPRVPWVSVPAGGIAKLRVSAAEKYLLSRCDGKRDLLDLARLAPMRELDVLKAMKRLAEQHVVELR
ncbi:MAG: DUF4388 domain-containing protein [Anaeromyxobacteraceae bacterium]